MDAGLDDDDESELTARLVLDLRLLDDMLLTGS